MNARKERVIAHARKLFMEKGYKETAIQDIIDSSGISKSTFYNYFSSKSEIFKAVYISVRNKFHKERDELLIDQNVNDIDIFIKQLELQIISNHRNKLYILIEEVITSNEPELRDYLKKSQCQNVQWTYNRLVEIFGPEKEPYLLDCSIMLLGLLQHSFYYHYMAKREEINTEEIISYCIDRIKVIIEDVSHSKVQLLKPNQLKSWLQDFTESDQDFHYNLIQSSNDIKKIISKVSKTEYEKVNTTQLVDFVREELSQKDEPRVFLIKSALLSLNTQEKLSVTEEFKRFEKLVQSAIID